MSEADFLFKMLGVVGLLLGLAVAAKKLFFSRVPQPFEVSQTDPPMSRRECTMKHEHFEIRLAMLEKRFDTHLVEVRDDIKELHTRITDNHKEVIRAIGRLEGSDD